MHMLTEDEYARANKGAKDCPAADNPLVVQIGGTHYKEMAIQPVEYILANNLPFIEGCVVKYVSRWRGKGGVEDLRKARHFLDLLISHEEGGR